MIFRKFICLLTLLTISAISFAGVVKVDLKEGWILPGETIVINLDELVPNHVYVLSCVLTSDHVSGNPYTLALITTPTNSPKVGVTADETSSGNHIYQLPTNKNAYIYGDIDKSVGDISIMNLDPTNRIQLSSCHAVTHM